MNRTFSGITPLQHLGIIRAQGTDAARFLHGQLTQDFSLQKPEQARLAAFLSAKGRMQASFIGIKRNDAEILLVCSRDLLAATLKRLSMFVLRSQVKLSDASADFTLLGLTTAITHNPEHESTPTTPWIATHTGNTITVQLYPAVGQERTLWLAPIDTIAPEGSPMPSATWAWSEVMSGVATLTEPVIDMFVPQMLNYESIGGVSFKKGCYPGQEVVARSQFRGAIKRRTYLARTDTAVSVGDEIFAANDTSQACGVVVQAAPVPATQKASENAHNVLACIQTHAANEVLQIGTNAHARLTLMPLPYALVEDI